MGDKAVLLSWQERSGRLTGRRGSNIIRLVSVLQGSPQGKSKMAFALSRPHDRSSGLAPVRQTPSLKGTGVLSGGSPDGIDGSAEVHAGVQG
jgi:hypothetical protein